MAYSDRSRRARGETATTAFPSTTLAGAARRRALWQVSVFPVAPALVISGMLWVQYAYAMRNPELVVQRPRTISSAVNDPAIGLPFEILVFAAAPFLLYAVWLTFRYYLHSVNTVLGGPSGRPALGWRIYIFSGAGLQIIAAVGMLVMSHFPSHTSPGPHIIASYMLFAGHSISILMCGVMSRILAQRGNPDMAAEHRGRLALSLCVVAIAVTYAALFYAPQIIEIHNRFAHALAVATVEVVMIAAFLLFLLSYTRAVFGFEQRRFLRSRARH